MSDAPSTRTALLAALLLAVVASGVAAAEKAQKGGAPAAPELSPEAREALSLEGDARAGAESWERCAVCHLETGAGTPDGIFPRIAGQHRSVVIKELVDMREGRRRNAVMEAFARHLIDTREIADVAAYLETLPVPRENGKGGGESLELGERLYQRTCARCHGSRGEGDAEHFVPVLAGQHYAYMLRQIRSIAAGRRHNADPALVEITASFSDAELQAMVDYASRLEWPESRAAE